jgi:hypothetical protein
MDLFVFTSLHESFAISVVEAQYFGVPVVTTDMGPAQEVIRDGKTGWIIDRMDAEAIADRVCWCLTRPDWLGVARKRARAFARSTFALERLRANLIDLVRGGARSSQTMMPISKRIKIIPDIEKDTHLERDLRFRPCTNANPQTLTTAQIEAFNRDGYISPIRVFDQSEAAENRRYLDDLMGKVLASGQDSYSITAAHRSYGKVYDLLTHPRIVALAKDLLGEDVVGWGSHYFCKMPHDGKQVSWHQDASYWPLSESKTVSVWLAIDDAEIENACMRFLPGTHKFGHLTYKLSEQEEENVLNQTVGNVERFGAPVYDILKAGEISIHSDLLLHGSEANNSDRRRCGLSLRYCAADVRADMGWNEKGVIVSGEDPSGHWSNPPRPELD